MNKNLVNIGIKAKKAARTKIDSKSKNKVLIKFLQLIEKNKIIILKENSKDIKFATKKNLPENLINRLLLNQKKLEEIKFSINKIIKLGDPINRVLDRWKRPNGLIIKRVSTPIGVIGVIYESRPNVTSDVSSLCFKSGNVVILRGGSEAYNSNKILVNLFRDSLKINNIDQNYVQIVKTKDRKSVIKFVNSLKLFGYGYSWGGFESLALHQSKAERGNRIHSDIKEDEKIVRLHIGLEDPKDLIEDLRKSLRFIK